jgi:hypothetical protein
MELEKIVALVALAWLVGVLLLMALSIRRGRNLADRLATRHPELYEAAGRPRPGFLPDARRNRFASFVGRREYEKLPDPQLAAEFEEFRRSETRLVFSVLASLVVVFLLVLAVRHGA